MITLCTESAPNTKENTRFHTGALLEHGRYLPKNVGDFPKNVGDFPKNVGDFPKNVGEFPQ